jgi:DNA-binding transcriptional LysR family regulator
MELKILEDFVALADTGSFSKAACLRHVTQPAFSRRIKTLENWFGATLIDRSHYPTVLTPEGKSLYETAKQTIGDIYQCKKELRSSNQTDFNELRFSMAHTLSINFFPEWRSAIEKAIGAACIKIMTGNIHDSAQLLDSGSCDFVLFFDSEEAPTSCYNGVDFARIKVGSDTLIPVSCPKNDGTPLYNIDQYNDAPIPYLAWGQPSFIDHVVSKLINKRNLTSKLRLRYQNPLSSALRAEALLGNGIAWLPKSLIKQDIDTVSLVCASKTHTIPIDIYIVKKRSNTSELSLKWWEAININYSL